MRMGGLAVALAMVAVWLPAAAHAAGGDAEPAAVVLASDPRDWVGLGQQHVVRSPADAIGGGWRDTGWLTINAGGRFSLDFAAPRGQPLAPGHYQAAQRAGYQDAGRPGLDVSGQGRGCTMLDGRFEVREIDVTPEGDIRRLWIVFEQHCQAAIQALYGEVRIGMPSSPAYTAPSLVRWPEGDLGRPNSSPAVSLVATAPLQVGGVAVEGSQASAFPVRADGCSGRSLGAGESCDVRVGYEPGAAGTHRALLRIGDRTVPLEGFTHAGTTRFVVKSESGDYMGNGWWDHTLTPNDMAFRLAGRREHLKFSLQELDDDYGGDDTYWEGLFFPPEGSAFELRRYDGAVLYSSHGSKPGMFVGTGWRSCESVAGEFTLDEATYDAAGMMRTLGVSFVQRCDGASAALRGRFDFRNGDRTPPAPWMGGGETGSGGGDPGGGGGGGDGGSGGGDGGGPGPGGGTYGGPCMKQRTAAFQPLAGGSGGDRLRGGAAAEVLLGLGGSDRIRAGAGADCVDAGAGHDVVSAGAGNDRVYGGAGRDRLDGGPGRDLLNCGSGRDVARVTKGDRTKGCERVIRPRS